MPIRWELVLPLVLAALVVLLVVAFVWRASRALARTREVEAFQRHAADLSERLDTTLRELADRVDAVRRHTITPPEIEPMVAEATESLDRYLAEADAIAAPAELVPTRDLIRADIERAQRAVEMIRHGCELADDRAGRRGELEAQTAIKRGYLNLLHAREESREHLDDLAAAREAGSRKWRSSRVEGASTGESA